jgi:hypothetical protein
MVRQEGERVTYKDWGEGEWYIRTLWSIFCFCGAEDGTQDLMHARQVL